MSFLSSPANARTTNRVTDARRPEDDAVARGQDQVPSASGSRAAVEKLSFFERCCRSRVLRALANLGAPGVIVEEHGRTRAVGRVDRTAAPTLRIHCSRFWKRLALGGSLGAAEAYIDGDWDCDELVSLMQLLARQAEPMARIEHTSSMLTTLLHRLAHAVRMNSRAGSRRNIAAHYDLSNDLFALFLDDTMTYSSGIFPTPEATLRQASVAKYDRIAQKMQLSPRNHVLEIGSGWGGFAVHAARYYGCRVTATTLSQAQYEFADRRIAEAGVGDRVQLLRSDYRDLRGQFDKLVSIEMIEAVGQRFLATFFQMCSRLLKVDGAMLLQGIVMPDCRYDRYRRGVDFIQRYIFPGGFLPSHAAIGQCVRYHTNLQLVHLEAFGSHYAETLARWRERFVRNLSAVRKLGFDRQFIRTWLFYFCYCEAGFRQRQVDVSQMMFVKPYSNLQASCHALTPLPADRDAELGHVQPRSIPSE